MNIFSGCQIALELGTKVPFKKKQQLRKTITENGGIVSFIITKKCSHLVVDDRENVSDTYKARTALKYGVPVVSLTFIDDCLKAEKLLDADGYIAVGKTKAEEFGSGKIVAKTQSEGPPKRKVVQLQAVKAWQWGDNKAPHYDDNTYQVAKSIVLVKKGKWKNLMVTKFCVLEMHIAPPDAMPATDNPIFRVFTHSGELCDKDDLGQKEVRFSGTPDEALDLFGQLYKYWTTSPNNYSKTRQFLSPRIGSPKFKQMLCDYGMEQGSMSEEACDLLEHIWQEAVGELDQTLGVPMNDIKADQIEKAEAALVELKQALNKKDKSTVKRLSDEFYSHLPHKSTNQQPIDSKGVIARKQDLCQLLKDMVSVSEATNWAVRSSVEAKYRALRCHVVPLSNDSAEYNKVMSLMETSTDRAMNVSVVNIYTLHRGVEEAVFNGNLGNNRLLFHASGVKNFVGILSRGLLKPKVVVDDFGGKRTDAGMLGNGIYFADDSSVSVKYSQPSTMKGTRMLLINEVSLGKCADLYKFDTELTVPPSGYNSVCGMRTEAFQSDFKDKQYVIYDTSQQRLRYLVEFSLPDDKVSPIISQSKEEEEEPVSQEHSANIIEIGLDDVKDVVDPQSTVTAGLVSSSDAAVPLTSVHVRAKLVDLAAQVVVLQAYVNENNEPIEAKYVFPLGEMAVVCGFEAFINGKHVVGEVKEKETAHREYKEAVAAGHGAYLMDQHDDLPDVFTVSVGNIPPKASVLIKITYVAELQVDGEKICFSVPSNVAPWSKQKAFDDVTQTELTTVNVDKETQNEVTIQVAIEMPFDIRSITCPTHRVRLKQTATKATVEMEKNQSLNEGFQLRIHLAQIHVPRMWVERYPGTDSEACMLTFYPEFDAVSRPDFEVVFLLDLSNSMDGLALMQAKKLLLLLIHHLPPKSTFNIVVFGTVFDELFPASQPKTMLNEKAARHFIQETSATMGNTEVLRPLHAYFLLGGGAATRNVFLVSDGHINAEELTLQAVSDNAPQTRLFTFAVGSTANRHLLRRLAQAGAGAYEMFDGATKYKWEERVMRQLSKAAQPSLSSVSVSWQQFDTDVSPLQAPSHVTALFSGSRQVIYGLVSNCTQAELKAVIDNQEISTMVSTTELNITTGKILHQLTARAAIRDWEEGILADIRTDHEITKKNRRNLILQLSTKYSIVTQFTSFVAVEKREEGETFRGPCGPSIAQLVQQESVDALEYVAWDDDVKPTIIQYVSSAEEEEICDSWEVNEEGEPPSDEVDGFVSDEVCYHLQGQDRLIDKLHAKQEAAYPTFGGSGPGFQPRKAKSFMRNSSETQEPVIQDQLADIDVCDVLPALKKKKKRPKILMSDKVMSDMVMSDMVMCEDDSEMVSRRGRHQHLAPPPPPQAPQPQAPPQTAPPQPLLGGSRPLRASPPLLAPQAPEQQQAPLQLQRWALPQQQQAPLELQRRALPQQQQAPLQLQRRALPQQQQAPLQLLRRALPQQTQQAPLQLLPQLTQQAPTQAPKPLVQQQAAGVCLPQQPRRSRTAAESGLFLKCTRKAVPAVYAQSMTTRCCIKPVMSVKDKEVPEPEERKFRIRRHEVSDGGMPEEAQSKDDRGSGGSGQDMAKPTVWFGEKEVIRQTKKACLAHAAPDAIMFGAVQPMTRGGPPRNMAGYGRFAMNVKQAKPQQQQTQEKKKDVICGNIPCYMEQHFQMAAEVDEEPPCFLDTLAGEECESDSESTSTASSYSDSSVTSLTLEDFKEQEGLAHSDEGCMKNVAHLQSSEGYWEFSAELDDVTGMDGDRMKTFLLEAGLRSLGEKVMTDVMRLVCTLKLLLWLASEFLFELLTERPADLSEQLRHVLDKVINTIHDHDVYDCNLPCESQEILEALRYCIRVTREHPLVFSQLELGRTWKVILMNVFLKVSQRPRRIILSTRY